MKTKIIELDVDCIGNQGSALTKEEEKAISEFIQSHKPRRKISTRKKVTV